MKRYTLFPLAAVIAMMVAALASTANAGGCLDGRCGSRRTVCCPQCDCKCYSCKLESDVVDVEKKCFEVEEDVICVPNVVFPWQTGKKRCKFNLRKLCGRDGGSSCDSCDSCGGVGCSTCVHNGAKIRKIKKLKSKKYTCPECEYTWTPEEKEASPCCGGNCGCGGATSCEGECCDAMMAPMSQPLSSAVIGSESMYPEHYPVPQTEIMPAPVVESNFNLQSYEVESDLEPVEVEAL